MLKAKIIFQITHVLEKIKVKHSLLNRTLLYAVNLRTFSEDEVEFVAVKTKKKIDYLINLFKKNKFKIKKINYYKNIFTIEKKKINVTIIAVSATEFIFEAVKIQTNILFDVKKIKILKYNFNVPINYKLILNNYLFLRPMDVINNIFYEKNLSFNKKILFHFKVFISIYLSLISKNFINFKLYFNSIYYLSFFEIISLILKKIIFKRKKIVAISEKKFRNLNFDGDKYNWIFRKKHMAKFTNNCKLRKIDDIINYINKNYNKITKNIKDLKTDKKFELPIDWNKKFWGTGNNLFIYSIIFQFKKNCLPYKEINNYIVNNYLPRAFTKKYFLKLEDMNDEEISEFLFKNPIKIKNNSFISGRHRVAAMIGRLVHNKKYIPIIVYK